jgi:STE24 endopeptidase
MENYPSPDPARQELAVKYETTTRRLSLVEMVLTGIILLAILFSGAFLKLSYLLDSPQPWIISVYFILLMFISGLVSAPITYYTDYIMARRYGLSTQSFKSWLKDKVKGGLLALILGLVVIIFIYWMMDITPDTWWIWSGCFVVLLMVIFARLTPTLLISLFFKLEPLKDTELETRLKKLADRARTAIMGIFTIDLSSKGTTANAMLGGLGKTRRIILTDTLLQTYSHEEIEVILAHELAHHLHRDIIKMIVLQALIIFLGLYLGHLVLSEAAGFFGYQSICSPATLPLLFIVFAFYSAIMSPILNACSRSMEKSADATAIELSVNPVAFISAMTRLVDQNLSVAQPKRWIELLFYSHPPYNKRVKLAHDYIRKNSGGIQ